MLIVVNGEGVCHIFDFSFGDKLKEKEATNNDIKEPIAIEPCAKHHVPTNTCAILVADYGTLSPSLTLFFLTSSFLRSLSPSSTADGDRNHEVIFGTSDSMVYALQFSLGHDDTPKRLSTQSLPSMEKSSKKEKARWRLAQPISALTFCSHPELPAIVVRKDY